MFSKIQQELFKELSQETSRTDSKGLQIQKIDLPNGAYAIYVEALNMSVKYDKDGQVHSEKGPAVQNDDIRYYAQNGKLHRLDGPAIEVLKDNLEYERQAINGLSKYFIDDKPIQPQDFHDKAREFRNQQQKTKGIKL